MVSLTILTLGYLGFKQPIIFPPDVQELKIKKYERSSLTIDKADLHLQVLLTTMRDKKPYLDNELTLAKLADMLSIPQHHLSQILNEKLNQNFFDFVNGYRIKEAKEILVSPEGELLTILAIAEEVGFNSKSAFNNAFKKVTNTTPSEFKKKHL
jgi:AraC-like DNA-binding protein